MANIVRIFISERYRRSIVGIVWLAAFCLSLGLIGWYAGDKVVAAMESRSDRVMAGFLEIRASVETAFAPRRRGAAKGRDAKTRSCDYPQTGRSGRPVGKTWSRLVTAVCRCVTV